MNVSEEIETRLRAKFAPQTLEVVNESHLHIGHAGHDGSTESHFRVVIRAEGFAAMGRLARHRAVIAALGEIPSRIHALALDIG